jgi:hypothetical protein
MTAGSYGRQTGCCSPRSREECVTALAAPPPAGIVEISWQPPRNSENAIESPSGDHAGSTSESPGVRVNRLHRPSESRTDQRWTSD